MIKREYGLIGRDIKHSFSPGFFKAKFLQENINDSFYRLYPLKEIEDIKTLFNQSHLRGLNVTIPYKEAVISYLTELDSAAKKIQAVNTIVFSDGKTIGHNTDVIGFEQSLVPLLTPSQQRSKALVLGTGGAAKAVIFVLKKLGIAYTLVSRVKKGNTLDYKAITPEILKEHLLIINTTPLGMSPNINTAPGIPYSALSSQHLAYDLVYNPRETLFLTRAKVQGASIKNGYEMLVLQAEASWSLWNQK